MRNSQRAGIANFGAVVGLADSQLDCNAIHLDGEPFGASFRFDDGGGNECGCGAAREVCRVLTADLAPPEEER